MRPKANMTMDNIIKVNMTSWSTCACKVNMTKNKKMNKFTLR